MACDRRNLRLSGGLRAGEDGAHTFDIDAEAKNDLRKQLFRAAVDNKWTLLELTRQAASLEDVFRNLTTGEESRS